MGRFARSWSLMKASAQVLRADKELLVFPLAAGAAALVVVASFLLPIFGLGLFERGMQASPAWYLVGFLFYLAQYFVMFFFNCALVGAAMIRLDGGDPTVRDGLRIAWSKVWPILGYAAIAATVGLLLRAIEERAGLVGRIVVGLVGVAWTVATFLTVPLLVARDIGPIDAVKESAALLRRSWGENLIGNGGIGIVFGLMTAAVAIAGFGGAFALLANGAAAVGVVLAVLTGLGILALGLVQTALSGIYSAALYRYAVDGAAPAGFDGALLEGAFRHK